MKHLIIINLVLLLFCSCTKEDFSPIVDELSTGDASKISNTTALTNISVTKNSQTKEIGILYSTSPTPEYNNAIKDSTIDLSARNLTLRGLTAGTLYYYRAYASDGSHYTYGDIKQFTTTNHKIIAVAAGESHALAIDETGTLWGWGSNLYHELGDAIDDSYTSNTVIIKEGTKFKAIAATTQANYSLAIDESGNLWLWGSDLQGGDKHNTPIQIMPDKKFKEITCGLDHLFAIDETGALWAWGMNNFGQLGNGTITDDVATPVQIKADTKFKSIAAGGRHSLAIDEAGNLWTWGNNSQGQLGCGTATKESSKPILIMSDTKFKAVFAGCNTSIAIDELGNTWAWGDDSRLESRQSINWFNPVILKHPGPNYQAISPGLSSVFLAIDEAGTLWGCGWLIDSPNNPSTLISLEDAIPLSNTKYKTIATGAHSSFVIDESGKLWEIGSFLTNKPLTLINQF